MTAATICATLTFHTQHAVILKCTFKSEKIIHVNQIRAFPFLKFGLPKKLAVAIKMIFCKV